MPAKAYLVAIMSTVGVPYIQRLDIFGCPAGALTIQLNREYPVDIMSVESDDYQSAHLKLYEILRDNATYHWMFRLLGENKPRTAGVQAMDNCVHSMCTTLEQQYARHYTTGDTNG